MRDYLHILENGNSDVQTFVGNSQTGGASWQVWDKPRGKSMINIQLTGKGGNGGLGVVGAVSLAAGGGGGGSGGQTSITMPLSLLPDQLFLSLGGQSQNVSLTSYVCVGAPATASPFNNVLITAFAGGNGGNALGATPGTVGAAAINASAANMPLGWKFIDSTPLAGQAGVIGAATGAGATLTIPTTGLTITGGTGGAGLGITGSSGSIGGIITGNGIFPTITPSPGGQGTTAPPSDGVNGLQPIEKLFYFYGGTGGGSTHGSATGAGLFASVGGFGGYGCGGGGNGGAFTGTTPRATGDVGLGGPAYCIITCW